MKKLIVSIGVFAGILLLGHMENEEKSLRRENEEKSHSCEHGYGSENS